MILESLIGILTIVTLIAVVADVVRNVRKTNTPAFSLAVASLVVMVGVVYGWKNASTGSVGLFLCDMFIIVTSTLNARSAVGRMSGNTSEAHAFTLAPGERVLVVKDDEEFHYVPGQDFTWIDPKKDLAHYRATPQKELATRQDVLKDLGLENN